MHETNAILIARQTKRKNTKKMSLITSQILMYRFVISSCSRCRHVKSVPRNSRSWRIIGNHYDLWIVWELLNLKIWQSFVLNKTLPFYLSLSDTTRVTRVDKKFQLSKIIISLSLAIVACHSYTNRALHDVIVILNLFEFIQLIWIMNLLFIT